MNDFDEGQVRRKDQTVGYMLKKLALLWSLLGQYKRFFVLAVISLVVIKALGMVTPLLWKAVFDHLQVTLATGGTFKQLFFMVACIGLVMVVEMTLYNRFFMTVFLKMLIELENEWPLQLQRKLLYLSMAYHHKENTGKKISKIISGCEKLTHIVGSLFWGVLPALFYIVINMIVLFFISIKICIIYVTVMSICLMFIPYLHRRFGDQWDKYETMREEATGRLAGSFLNIDTVKHFAAEDYEYKQHLQIRQKMIDLDLKTSFESERWVWGIGLFLHLSFWCICMYALSMVLAGEVQIGTIVFLVSTGGTISHSFWRLMHEYKEVLRNMYAVERIQQIFQADSFIPVTHCARPVEYVSADIVFKDVYFRYNEKTNFIVDNLSMVIHAGKMHAFVGTTGAGKSTIIALIQRLYDPCFGTIHLGKEDLRDLDLYSLRSQYAVVSQVVGIFDGTIEFNVRYSFLNVTDAEVEEALRAAQLDVVLTDNQRFPQGMKTEVGERGIQLSGGERQRVGIARAYLALLKGRRILVLDEATASLDRPTEKLFQEAVDRIRTDAQMAGITIIAIAHRISTIKNADYIHVIKGGRIVESGQYNDLINLEGAFTELAQDDFTSI